MPATLSTSLLRPRRRVVLSLTPLIDVVFILLVFFMLVSQFADWRRIDLSPPAALAGASSDKRPLTFSLLNDGSFEVAGSAASSLTQAVALAIAARAQDGVMLTAEDRVAIQDVVDAVAALSSRGITDVRLIKQPPESPS